MRRYGSDKPDLRFDIELVECADFFSDTTFRVFQAPYVGAVVMPGGASQPRKQLDRWQEFAKQRGHKGLAYVLVGEDGTLGGPVAKNLTDAERDGLAAHVGANNGDAIFFSAGPVKASRGLLGAVRGEIARKLDLIDPKAWAFVWVVDAPLFEPTSDATASGDVAVGSGAWTAVHHAFTSPKPESMDSFDTDPGSALAYAYDIVCNARTSRNGCSRSWVSARKRHRRSSASFSMPSPTAHRRTAVSRSAGIESPRCLPESIPSERSSRSRSPAAVSTR